VSDAPAPNEPRDAPIDLDAIERTRLGFKLAGLGSLIILWSVPGATIWFSTRVAELLRVTGWVILGLGLWLMAPTPNGPMPRWLGRVYVALCALAALRVAKNALFARASLGAPPPWFAFERMLVIALVAAFLALPWIYWRFCQYRGLTGRALTWLWSAALLCAMFALDALAHREWFVFAYPLLGLVLFVVSRQTARDVWLDALVRQTKLVARTA
jgi:hypothetical protein